jgi:hypothetical protein
MVLEFAASLVPIKGAFAAPKLESYVIFIANEINT